MIANNSCRPSVRWGRCLTQRGIDQALIVIAIFLWTTSLAAGLHDAPSRGLGTTPVSMDAGQPIERANRRVMELTQTGDYLEATALAEANLGSALRTLAPDHPYTDTALDNLAFLYEIQERDAQAQQILAQLAELRMRRYGPEHLFTAMAVRRLATVYVRLGQTETADELLHSVTPIFEKRLGAGHWLTIAATRALARMRGEQGRFQDAAHLYRKAVTALEDRVGRRHQDTASVLSDFGALYARQKRFGDAERILSEALEIQNARLGPESIEASFTRTRLAWAYMDQRRYPDAERIFRQELAIAERVHGTHHPETARALQSLSYALVNQKKHVQAERALTRSLAIFRAVEGPQSGNALQATQALVRVREEQGRLEEAAGLLQELIDRQAQRFGATANEATSLQLRLAWLRGRLGAHEQAEALFREVLAIRQPVLGASDPGTLEARAELANFLRKRARYAEAMELFGQNLKDVAEAKVPDPAAVLDALIGLANVLLEQGRYDEAEAHLRRAIANAEQLVETGQEGHELSTLYNNLATVYQSAGRYSDAKNALATSIRITEEEFGPSSVLVATGLQNLGTLYTVTGDYESAEKLFGRALSLYRETARLHAAELAQLLGNQANLCLHKGDLTQAELALDEALQLGKSVLGERHPVHGLNLNTAALLAQTSGDIERAERYLRQALAIFEGRLGPQHPHSTRAMSNLGTLLVAQDRFAEAWTLLETAQAGIEASLGPAHPDTASGWAALAYHSWKKGDAKLALSYIRRANDVFRTQPRIPERQVQTSWKALGPQSIFTLHLDILAALLGAPGQDRTALNDEAFRVGQQMRQTSAARALQRTAARFAAGTDDLARAVREHQDLAAAWKAADAALISRLSGDPDSRDSDTEQALRARLAATQQALEMIEERLRREFPPYAELMHPTPLGVRDAQALLGPSEALVAYLIGSRQSYAWVLRPKTATLHALDLDASELRDIVAAVRAGLDPRSGRGARRLGVHRSTVAGFNVGRVRRLYAKIWMPFARELDKVEHVVVVPDGPLQSLPLTVLVEGVSKPLGTTLQGLRNLRWLIRRHAFSQLPAVSSLKALRTLTNPLASGKAFVGFGDPQLADGHFRHLRLAPLPESAQELQALARLLNAAEVQLYLGGEATERQVRSVDFAGVGILAFATHGLMAGEADGLEEPGLVLTPPESPTDTEDGFLSASEVAELKLNLDWVILSACNTAASDGMPGGEGLSGLARSFFYAGARSMLVSHWSVYSAAAVDITTGMLLAMADAPNIGRAEALRRSLAKLIDEGENPHPSYWAPFILVGDGRGSQWAAR